ncbi:MAG: molybdopterin cofactor-binding domain-containing protein [Betaproteobacteria bacterium]
MSTPPPKPLVSLQANPRLGQWLAFHANGSVTVRSGKVEIGQGIRTALAQIVAQALDLDLSRVHMLSADTAISPNEGVTAGSLSITDSGGALRQVCAQARQIYLDAAARQFGLGTEQRALLQVRDGQIGLPDAPALTSYWQLADPALLEHAAGEPLPTATSSAAPEHLQRLDLPAKVLGQASFVHDMELLGMLHGAVVQAPSPAARLLEVDLQAAQALPGVVAVLRSGSFLGLVAQTEYQALQARARLAALARWQEEPSLPEMQALAEHLRQGPVDTHTVSQKTGEGAAAVQSLSASYQRPFLAHASIAPSCAVATYTPGQPTQLEVWSHTQGVFNLRADLATMLGLPPEAVRVRHADGAGCYGHNGADDVAGDAALLARAVPGRPVRLQWSREDELSCAPVGAAMVADLQADLDAHGRISRWQHQVWSTGHSMRPGRSPIPVLRAAAMMEPPFERQVAINMPLAVGGGAERNAVPLYDFASHEVLSHRALRMPIRTSSLRSLGAHLNVFAAECFMDELAEQAGTDPLTFRLRHLADARARAVLERVAALAGWSPAGLAEGRGWGLGLTRYKNTGAWCAAVAQVDLRERFAIEQLWLVVDAGRLVNPDGARNQIEGGAIQTLSWVTKEQVAFDRTRITSNTWDSYPILKFSEVAPVEVEFIDRPEQPSLGVGEASHGPVAAALANAVYAAVGVRMRSMPINADTIARAALAS